MKPFSVTIAPVQMMKQLRTMRLEIYIPLISLIRQSSENRTPNLDWKNRSILILFKQRWFAKGKMIKMNHYRFKITNSNTNNNRKQMRILFSLQQLTHEHRILLNLICCPSLQVVLVFGKNLRMNRCLALKTGVICKISWSKKSI